MGLSETTFNPDTSSKNAKEFLRCVGEELDRATDVLNNLKPRNDREISTLSKVSPYEFLRRLDKETLFSTTRQNFNTPAIFQKQQQQVALPPWWKEKPALLSLLPPTESPLLLSEQSEFTTASGDDLDLQDKDFKDGQRCFCLGVRLLKMDEIEPYSCKEMVNSSTRLLHCPAVLNQDSTSSIASSTSSLLTPATATVPSGDLAAVVSKLRQMTASVVKLQSTLEKSLEAKKAHQQMQQQEKGNAHGNFHKIKLTRF